MEEKRTTRWSQLLHCAQNGLARFPLVSISALVLFICTNLPLFLNSYPLSRILDAGCFGAIWAMLFGVVAQLICERYHIPRRNPFPWLATLLAGLLGWWLRYTNDWLRADFRWRDLILYSIPLLCVVLAIWLLYGEDNRDSLFAALTKNLLFSGAVTGIVLIGLQLCYLAAHYLLFRMDFYWGMLVLTFPFEVLFPILFCSQLPACGQNTELPRVFRLLAGRAALPLYLFLIGILYGYIGKILFTWKMPSGTMNWFASLALAGYLFFWLTLRQDTAPWVQKFLRWGWAGLLPILAVQLVGIVIRLRAYGLTTLRYAGLLCLAVGIVGLLLAAWNRHPKYLFLVGAVVLLAGTCTPLNVIDLPRYCQTRRIESVLREHQLWDGSTLHLTAAELSADEQETLHAGLIYLHDNRTPAQWQSNLTRQLLEHPLDDWNMILDLSASVAQRDQEWFLKGTVSVPVQGYDTLYPIHWYCDTSMENAHLFTEEWEDGTSVQWDGEAYLQEVTQNCENDSTLPEAYRLVEINDTQALYFTELFLRKPSSSDRAPGGRLDGYLLVKTSEIP